MGAEKWLELTGVKDEANGTYLIESVEQSFTKSAWVTSININAGNGGKGKVGRDKKDAGSRRVINLGEAAK